MRCAVLHEFWSGKGGSAPRPVGLPPGYFGPEEDQGLGGMFMALATAGRSMNRST